MGSDQPRAHQPLPLVYTSVRPPLYGWVAAPRDGRGDPHDAAPRASRARAQPRAPVAEALFNGAAPSPAL